MVRIGLRTNTVDVYDRDGSKITTVRNGKKWFRGTKAKSKSVKRSDYFGELCGLNALGYITNCYATGSVIGVGISYKLGGLCGGSIAGTISNCYATVSVPQAMSASCCAGDAG